MNTIVNKPKMQYWMTRSWVVFLIGIGVVILHYTTILRPVENLLTYSITPFQVFAFEHGDAFTLQSSEELSQLSKEEIIQKYLELQDRVQNIQIENAHLRTLTEEAALLKTQLEFLEKKSYNAQTAKVITRSSEGLSRSVVINKGAQDGIQEGYPVITENGIVIGTISSTTDYTSQVRLITSVDAITSGTIQNDKNSPGILRGAHNLGMEMDFIPQNHNVAVGQMVVTSGTDQFIPRGLILGEVESVGSVAGSVFQQAQIRPLFFIESTFIVSVIIP